MRSAGIVILISFVVFQNWLTLNKRSDLYPFNPYRMFSKHWYSGIEMSKMITRSSDGQSVIWNKVHIPFFQINKLAHSIFNESNDSSSRLILCEALRSRMKISYLEVLSQVEQFTRGDQGLIIKTTQSEKVYACGEKL